MARKIKVDVLNIGGTLPGGVKTPIYNYYMDEQLYFLFKEMGWNIQLSKEVVEPIKKIEPVAEVVIPQVIEEETAEEELKEDKKELLEEIERISDIHPFTIIATEEVTPEDEIITIEITDYIDREYSLEELKKFTMPELLKILNHRGLAKSRNGARKNTNRPFNNDRKGTLIQKVFNTNPKND